MKYEALCKQVLEAVGGRDNIKQSYHCNTRLRLTLKNNDLVDKEKLENITGIIKVNYMGYQTQLIIGSHVGEVYAEFCEIAGLEKQDAIDETLDDVKAPAGKKKFMDVISDVFGEIFLPLMPAIIGCGIIRGFLNLAVQFMGLDTATSTYIILFNGTQVVYYFMPILLAFTCSKRFKTTQMLSVVLAATLLSPNIVALLSGGDPVSLFGLPVTKTTYGSTCIPIILIVLFQSVVEKQLRRLPKALHSVVVPVLTLLICWTVAFVVIGPAGYLIGVGLAKIYDKLIGISPVVAGILIGGIHQGLVFLGIHTAFIPVMVNELTIKGYVTFCPFTAVAVYGQFGGLFATVVKAKTKKVKDNAAAISSMAIMTGFGPTEPAIYGNNVPLKTPFLCGMLGGAAGGAIMGLFNVKAYALANLGLFSFGAYLGDTFGYAVLACVVAFAVGFVLTYLIGFKEEASNE